MNLLFLDFDSGMSEANIFNRLHFMVKNAQSEIEKPTLELVESLHSGEKNAVNFN